MFDPSTDSDIKPVPAGDGSHKSFIPSKRPAHEEILRVLRENDPDTVTLVAVGPLTNLALASAADPEAFLRVKEVVVMGGAINEPGNVGTYYGAMLGRKLTQLIRSLLVPSSTHMPMRSPRPESTPLRLRLPGPRCPSPAPVWPATLLL